MNVAVLEHRNALRALLGDRLVGLYLHGSLALGDFDPATSDVDLLVATRDELLEADLAAVRTWHEAFDAGPSPWATEVEVSYLPVDALRRYDPARSYYAHVGRGGEGLLIHRYDSDWVIQLHILREHSLAVLGPAPTALVDPVMVEDRHAAARALARRWLPELLAAPTERFHRGYQVFVVLSMCRILHTAATGDAASKRRAAAWALANVPERFYPVVEDALVWCKADSPAIRVEQVEQMRALVSYIHERAA